jgi:aspartate carbamoyltransferase catalytic subunit
MKDLVSIKMLTKEEIISLLYFADEIKKKHKRDEEYKPLKDKIGYLNCGKVRSEFNTSMSQGL